MLSRLKAALRGLLRRSQAERELDEELRYHIEQQTEQNIRLGMSMEEARYAARRSFGGVEQAKEQSRDARGVRWLENIWQDLRYGLRMLLKNPGFTLIAAITLALGIGANTAIFSVVNGVLLRPLTYKDPQRLVMVFVTRPQSQEFPVMAGELIDLRSQNLAFEQVAAFRPQSLNLTGSGDPEILSGVNASANLFALLGVEARQGRAFLPEEEQLGKHHVVILSYRLWQRRFGSDLKIIGRTITLNDEPYTIVGVAPPDFQFPRKGDWQAGVWFQPEVDIYTPLALTPGQINNRRGPSLAVIARLKSQFSVEQAQAEMTGLAERLRQQYPDTDRDKGIRLVTLHQQVVGRVRLSLNETLKEGGRSSGAIGHNHFRNLLVVSEVALSLTLLAGAGLMLRSFIRLTSVDPGLDTRNVLALEVRLPQSRYAPPQQAVFFQQLLERLRALPGVQAASAVYPLPLSRMEDTIGFRIEGQPPPASSEWPPAGPRCIGAQYFKVLNIQLQKGRVFTESDGVNAPPVVIINEELARQYLPDQDPIGRRLAFNSRDGRTIWREVVGVVGDVRHMALDGELRPEIYFPFMQFPASSLTVIARTNGDPLGLVASVRSQVQAVDKDQPITNIRTMEEILARSVSQPRFNLLLLAIFAGLALSLAAVGIYGVMSYLVTQRTHEIGVRMALGAQVSDVLKLVIRQGMTLTLTGIVIGLITALGLTRLIKNLLFGVSATDPVTFSVIALLMALVALLACYLPARRATKVDPLVSLKYE